MGSCPDTDIDPIYFYAVRGLPFANTYPQNSDLFNG